MRLRNGLRDVAWNFMARWGHSCDIHWYRVTWSARQSHGRQRFGVELGWVVTSAVVILFFDYLLTAMFL